MNTVEQYHIDIELINKTCCVIDFIPTDYD